jgi:hypothetical protein
MKAILKIRYKSFLSLLLIPFFLISCGRDNESNIPEPITLQTEEFNPNQNLPTKRLRDHLSSWDENDSLITKIQIFHKEDSIANKAFLTINNGKDTLSFDDKLMDYFSDLREKGTRVKILLLADKDIPFGIIRYFEFLLRLNGINRLGYVNAHNENFISAFPPVEKKTTIVRLTNQPSRTQRRIKIFNPESISLLKSYGIDSIYNFTHELEDILIKPENFLVLALDSSLTDSIFDQGLANLFQDKVWHKKIIQLKTDDFANYEIVFNTHTKVLEYYAQIRDSISQADFQIPYQDLTLSQKKQIKSLVPTVYSRNPF